MSEHEERNETDTPEERTREDVLLEEWQQAIVTATADATLTPEDRADLLILHRLVTRQTES